MSEPTPNRLEEAAARGANADNIPQREHRRRSEEEFDEDAGLPSINRKANANKLTTIVGFVFIAVVGLAAIVAINRAPAEPPKRKEDSKIANRMPPFEMPAPERPPLPAHAAANTPDKQAEDDWMTRKLGGKLVISGGGTGAATAGPQLNRAGTGSTVGAEEERFAQLAALSKLHGQGGDTNQAEEPAPNSLAAHLTPTKTQMISASMLPNRNYVVAKGASLDCALETAINSSLPGMVTCRLTRDIYSDNGKVLLLDRGSQLVGEYRSALKQGQARIFLLWTRAKTPNGVIVTLDSPGTDALGRAGTAGQVDNHFWERFGSAILMSLVTDTVAAANRGGGGNSGNSTNIYNNTTASGAKIVESMLEQSANIPPTLFVNQGEHVQVLVARDLDFSSVYALKPVP